MARALLAAVEAEIARAEAAVAGGGGDAEMVNRLEALRETRQTAIRRIQELQARLVPDATG